jgi:hypothetical protein
LLNHQIAEIIFTLEYCRCAGFEESAAEWAQDLQIIATSVVSSRQENKAFSVSLNLF